MIEFPCPAVGFMVGTTAGEAADLSIFPCVPRPRFSFPCPDNLKRASNIDGASMMTAPTGGRLASPKVSKKRGMKAGWAFAFGSQRGINGTKRWCSHAEIVTPAKTVNQKEIGDQGHELVK